MQPFTEKWWPSSQAACVQYQSASIKRTKCDVSYCQRAENPTRLHQGNTGTTLIQHRTPTRRNIINHPKPTRSALPSVMPESPPPPDLRLLDGPLPLEFLMASSPPSPSPSRGLPLAKRDVGAEFLEDCARQAGYSPERLDSLALPRAGLRSIAADAWLLLPSLRLLNLARNGLSSVSGLEHLANLEELSLYFNRLGNADVCIPPLQHLRRLRVVDVRMNPLTRAENYRERLLDALPQLERLDSRLVSPAERHRPPNGEELRRQLDAAVADGDDDASVELAEGDEEGRGAGAAAAAAAAASVTGENGGEPRDGAEIRSSRDGAEGGLQAFRGDLQAALDAMRRFSVDCERRREEERQRDRILLRNLQDAQDALLKSNEALRYASTHDSTNASAHRAEPRCAERRDT
eukprot:scaffold1277_cov253-Pinguiococcus_pyrenoidosus.AAC.54